MILRFLSKTDPGRVAARTRAMFFLAGGLCVATGALMWFGYLATERWHRSALLLEERRAEERLALFLAALNRDMKGAQNSVLAPFNHQQLTTDAPYELADVFARAFARFPYPESFFVWRRTGEPEGTAYVFNRSDRPPAWVAEEPPQRGYPVLTIKNPPPVRDLVLHARQQGADGHRFAVFETRLSGSRYQVVVHLLYDAHLPGESRGENGLIGLVGYAVNLNWTREEYFTEMVRQVSSIGGRDDDSALTIEDGRGRLVTEVGATSDGLVSRERTFPLYFFDPALVASGTNLESGERWTVRVQRGEGGTVFPASVGSKRLFALIAISALASFVGVVVTGRAVLDAAEFASMKSEFVSTVTHELKTPLSLMSLVGETLAMGRYSSKETIKDYAELLSKETARLSLLIDNLLAYARLDDVEQVYNFEPLDIVGLAEDLLQRYQPRLEELGFRVAVEAPSTLPPVKADRVAMEQVFENLLDNAIKYSHKTRSIALRASSTDDFVEVQITDRGAGIPEEEVGRVFDKFFRGCRANVEGSGLGLAITRRILLDHGGGATIRSREGLGTTVTLKLPVDRATLRVA